MIWFVFLCVYDSIFWIRIHTVLHTESMTFSIAKMKVALNCFCCVKFDLVSFLIEWAWEINHPLFTDYFHKNKLNHALAFSFYVPFIFKLILHIYLLLLLFHLALFLLVFFRYYHKSTLFVSSTMQTSIKNTRARISSDMGG